MKTAICLLIVVACSGCFTPSHISNLRAQRAREGALKLTAKDGAVYAGVDILGVKEALQADPGGTSAALGKDAVLAVLAGLATAYVADQVSGDDGSDKASPPNPKEPKPTPSATVNGNFNDVTMPSTVFGSGPAVGINGNYNTVTITEPVVEAVVSP